MLATGYKASSTSSLYRERGVLRVLKEDVVSLRVLSLYGDNDGSRRWRTLARLVRLLPCCRFFSRYRQGMRRVPNIDFSVIFHFSLSRKTYDIRVASYSTSKTNAKHPGHIFSIQTLPAVYPAWVSAALCPLPRRRFSPNVSQQYLFP